MVFVGIVQFAVCFLILLWLLKKKPGARFKGKTVVEFVLFGALSMALCLGVSLVLPVEHDTFFGMNPILSGFLTALLTAALLEEVMKYIFFRLALVRNREVVCWLDAVIAAVLVAIGFVLLEDIEFIVSGSSNVLRAFLPGHLLFQGIMGYYYGKARVTKKFRYHVLSLALPILAHTLFDMFLIALMSIVGDINVVTGMSSEEIMSMPYANYMLPLLVCAVAVMILTFIALILMLRKISVWSKKGKKRELLKEQKA